MINKHVDKRDAEFFYAARGLLDLTYICEAMKKNLVGWFVFFGGGNYTTQLYGIVINHSSDP